MTVKGWCGGWGGGGGHNGREYTRVLFLTMERNSPEVAGRVLVTGSDTGVGGGGDCTGVTCGRVRDHGPGAGLGGGWLGHGPHSGPGGKAGPVAVCRPAPPHVVTSN